MKYIVKELYCDNHLLLLNKPPGLLTQPNGAEESSLLDVGKQLLKARFQKPAGVFLEPVHRLDKAASGIVLCARTSKALSRLQAALRAHAFKKKYAALVEGEMQSNHGILENYLFHDAFRATVVNPESKEAKKCRLKYTVIKRENGLTWLEIDLDTGRYHQIRAQLAHLGFPIVGDAKYGAHTASKEIFLHHMQLTFPHPISGCSIQINAPYFLDWEMI